MNTETEELSQLVSELAEHVAVDLLAEFQEEDYIHLDHIINKLLKVEIYLTSKGLTIPIPVKQVLSNYRRVAN